MNTERNNTYLHLPGLLSPAQLQQVHALSASASFEDGRKTATAAAREVKQNLQLDTASPAYMQLQQVLFEAMNQHTAMRDILFPKQLYPFIFSKYQPGMNYGWHVDSPIMGNMFRTDIAMTVFLNDPSEYEGGELELQTPAGTILYKHAAGDAVCYPCTQLHRVREVTKGERRVAVSWIQSMVKSAEQRNILAEMHHVIGMIREKDLHAEEANVLQQAHSNLLRMWSEN